MHDLGNPDAFDFLSGQQSARAGREKLLAIARVGVEAQVAGARLAKGGDAANARRTVTYDSPGDALGDGGDLEGRFLAQR